MFLMGGVIVIIIVITYNLATRYCPPSSPVVISLSPLPPAPCFHPLTHVPTYNHFPVQSSAVQPVETNCSARDLTCTIVADNHHSESAAKLRPGHLLRSDGGGSGSGFPFLACLQEHRWCACLPIGYRARTAPPHTCRPHHRECIVDNGPPL